MLFGRSGHQPTTLSKDFSRAPEARIKRSVFNRDHGLKTTINTDYLYPVFFDEILPGDTAIVSANGFGRLTTPINPFMDNLYAQTFFFFTPTRILWDNWEKFCGEQINPGDSIDYSTPQIQNVTIDQETLFDYFSVPTKVAGMSFNNFAGRAYNLIYNEWFRDENLQDSATVDLDDGPDSLSDYVLKKSGKRHDYFTSSMIAPQKGDSVTLPLGTTAPVTADVTAISQPISIAVPNFGATTKEMEIDGGSLTVRNQVDTNYPMYADLSDATAATINQLREAFQVQSFLELSMRGGTRYKEILSSMFGVTSPDMRLDRPELLSTNKSYINIQPIAQTSSTDSTTPQGNMSGFGTISFANHKFTKSFTEHGYIIGLLRVFADLTYQQGLNRSFSRRTRYDFYWPSFANLGEMAVLNQEIYAQGNSSDSDVFGYQEVWADYRYKPSQITGKMRSNATGTLDNWHLAQNFGSLPALNSSFIEESVPIDRVLAVSDEPAMLLDMFFKYKHVRPMPLYGTPFSLGHF